jgi:hypothetical protein
MLSRWNACRGETARRAERAVFGNGSRNLHKLPQPAPKRNTALADKPAIVAPAIELQG